MSQDISSPSVKQGERGCYPPLVPAGPSYHEYLRLKPQLLEQGLEGHIIILKQGVMLGTFPTESEALEGAYAAYGYVPFCLREIRREEAPQAEEAFLCFEHLQGGRQ